MRTSWRGQYASSNHSWVLVAITLLVSMILQIIPLAVYWESFWPNWVFLVVLYWCVSVPTRFQLASAFFIGLYCDILLGQPLGCGAIAFMLTMLIALLGCSRIKLMPWWQQVLWVLFLMLVYTLIKVVIYSFFGLPYSFIILSFQSVSTSLAWLFCTWLLGRF